MSSTRRMRPAEIEAESFAIITRELGENQPQAEVAPIVKRVIHTTADFDYAKNLWFSPGVVQTALQTLGAGALIVCDTNMVRAGINAAALQALGCEARCLIADPDVVAQAREHGTTRAAAAVDKAVRLAQGQRPVLFAVGNAPTALLRLLELRAAGSIAPAVVIGAPVGFVNVVESKTRLLQSGQPAIIAQGRKGGSNVAAAICNALLYMAGGREGESANS